MEVIYIFDWLGDFIGGIGSAIGGVFDYLGEQISNAIWNTMLQWFYETIYNAVADFFTMMGNMGADVFDLEWVQATINLFTLFGWALFVAGTVVAVFDVAIEYQNGRANIKTTAINVLKGFFACSLFGVVPVELYKFCISLQNTFSKDLSSIMAGQQSLDLAGQSTSVLEGSFAVSVQVNFGLLNLLCMVAFAYCVIKIFCEHQAWRNSAHSDGGRFAVYVQCSERLSGRLQSVDETDSGVVPDGIYADNSAVPRVADLPRQYAFGTWNNACIKRSSENCTAVRS